MADEPPITIPFNRASLAGREMELIHKAVHDGHLAGNGELTKTAEKQLATLVGGGRSLLTTSGTHALELAARTLRLQPGDEVIVPAYTFVSTASAFALTGATLRFVDVDPLTLNLDPEVASAAVNDRTRAICTVHYAGIGNRVDEVAQLCEHQGISLIEDNAHGLGGSYRGQPLGSFGRMSILSFHETKNITCGEGGALVLNKSADESVAEILREKGTDRAKFLRGQVDKYTWVDIGSSWTPSEILAGFLVAQLEQFDEIQRRRKAIWTTYERELSQWAQNAGVRTPHVPDEADHPAHMYYLQFPSLSDRSRFIKHMRQAGILTVFHYQALNTSAVGRSLGGREGQCPVTENAADTLVRLPLFSGMTASELEAVIDATSSFR